MEDNRLYAAAGGLRPLILVAGRPRSDGTAPPPLGRRQVIRRTVGRRVKGTSNSHSPRLRESGLVMLGQVGRGRWGPGFRRRPS